MNHSVLVPTVALAAALTATAASAAGSCQAVSGKTVAPVVELYTSEGCSSCPPADRWLSRIKGDPQAVALAFHVDYWDRLGWKDRFASAAWTERQAAQQRVNGARFSYTPQVVVDGRDRTDWPSIAVPLASGKAAPVTIALVRAGDRVTARVNTEAPAASRLAGYWAVTEQGHATTVKAGENSGATLHHDFVVRAWQPVAAWRPGAEPETLTYTVPASADPRQPRLVNFVVVDADSGKPLQALKLAC